jgi:D-glycero-D-manno-heptose 1,7-bisphosphate phosphatase
MAARSLQRKAVFLDRDGVINRAVIRDGKPYPPASLDEMQLLPQVGEALHALKAAGFMLIVVTNQPDVARGTTPRAAVDAIHTYLQAALPLDEIRCCFHDDHDACTCRKPKPGALLDAAKAHNLSLPESFMVGDRWRDIEAGQAAGVRTILVGPGYNEKAPMNAPEFTCGSLLDAAELIIKIGEDQ